MKFSICIPNYNYEAYLGRTIQSVLAQTYSDFEIVVSDNASTDKSVQVVQSFSDPRITLRVNACNIGFAGNLDRAARMATGDYLILLSSDDLLLPTALATYSQILERVGADQNCVLSAAVNVVDAEDRECGRLGFPEYVWDGSPRALDLEPIAGGEVCVLPARELLRRCLQAMKNPFHFASTAYPRKLYERVEGYGGGRLMNPDKWFHWKLLAIADRAFFIDRPMAAYRWHSSNQNAIQAGSGALKYLIDEYASTFEFDRKVLADLNFPLEDLQRAFIERDIVRGAAVALAKGQRGLAQRTIRFGQAAYPAWTRWNWKLWALQTLTCLGPVGSWFARLGYARHRRVVRNLFEEI